VPALSPRLREIVDALPLRPGLRAIEIGCGPGAAAKEVARRVGPSGHVLAVDRSKLAIDQLVASASDLIAAGRLSVRNVSCEELVLAAGEDLYNLAFAVRVGALDGRHPDAGACAMEQLARALLSSERVYVDGADPLRELTLPELG
jgi:SAM-dependent methyltransferase